MGTTAHVGRERDEETRHEITALLGDVRDGDRAALESIFQRLYPELRRLASSRLRGLPSGATLTPTVLVHEAFLRFAEAERVDLASRAHFFSCAARAMRHIVIDQYRASRAQKRGGEHRRVTLPAGLGIAADDADDLLDLDRALHGLAEINARALQVVELRFFAGLTAEEAAEILGVSLRTANREWRRARAYLYSRLQDAPSPAEARAR